MEGSRCFDGELGNFGSLHHRRGIRENEYRIRARIPGRGKRAVQSSHADEGQIERDDAQSFGCLLSSPPFRWLSGMIRVRQHRKRPEFWKYVLEQLNPFSRELQRKKRRTREITTWPREALDQAQRYRVAALGKQDRNVRYRRDRSRCRTARHGEIHVAAPQFGYHLAQRLVITRRVVKLKDKVLSLNVASRAQPFTKTLQERVGLGFSGHPKDAIELRWRLAMRGERPRQRAADKRHEISPSHLGHHG